HRRPIQLRDAEAQTGRKEEGRREKEPQKQTPGTFCLCKEVKSTGGCPRGPIPLWGGQYAHDRRGQKRPHRHALPGFYDTPARRDHHKQTEMKTTLCTLFFLVCV